MSAISSQAIKQIFTEAHTANKFKDIPVTDADLRAIYDLAKMPPTACNCQPARFLFLRSQEAKEKIRGALMGSNVEKTMLAPVVVVAAIDTKFYDHLPEQFPIMPVKGMFENNAAVATDTATRNGNLQAAYFILAARSLGFACGPMSGFDPAQINATFFPDGQFTANFLINLGFGDDSGNYPRQKRLEFDVATRTL